MRKPTITPKRVLGAVLAGSLAVAATATVAATSDAATAKFKVDATTSVGQVLTINGTDLVDDNGAAQFDTDGIRFTTSTCASTEPAAAATNTAGSGSFTATNAVAVSDTKATLDTTGFTPTLTAGKAAYTVCIYDNSSALLGSTTTTFYAVATTTAVLVGANGVTLSSDTAGPTLGGTKLTVKGQDFTSKTYVTVGGTKLTANKVTLGATSSDLDVITGTVPAGTGATSAMKLVGEFGSLAVHDSDVGSGATALTWAYTPAVTVSPIGSDGTSGRVVTLHGVGFSSRTFAAATGTGTGGGKSVVFLLPPNIANSAFISSNNSATPTGSFICASPSVVSDTELTCTIPSLTSAYGSYVVAIKTFTGAAGAQTLDTTNSTGYTRAAAYTAAAF